MKKLLLPLIFLLITAVACESDKDPLVVPVDYNGANFTTNANTELAVTQRLISLVNEVKRGRNAVNTLDATTLNNLFIAGTPNLQALNTDYYKDLLEGDAGFFAEISKASGNAYAPGEPTGEGGVYNGYLFDENGLELEQLIEKGQFGSVLYNHALTLLNGSLDVTTADKVLAIFGANPSFANSSDATKHTNPDILAAVYAARRDKNDGNGFYSILKFNFIKLQAAVAAGADYQAEQQEAIQAIKQTWERVNAATIINYCHSVISTLSSTELSGQQKANALHAYGECVGFAHGWRTISENDKIITDAQIDEILSLLNAPYNETPTSYLFVTDGVNQLPKLVEVIDELQAIYGFTDAQIEDFKSNWVSVQQR